MREGKKSTHYRWLYLGYLSIVLACSSDESAKETSIDPSEEGDGDTEGDGDDGDGSSEGDGDAPGAGDGDDVGGGDGDGDTPGPGDGEDDEPDAGTEVPAPTEGFLRGEKLAADNKCASCHQEDYSGAAFYPNLTPDKDTGLGKWSDAQIAAAITDGIGNDGKTLCTAMQRFEFSDGELADLVEYLRGIPSVKNNIKPVCPGHGK
jgi:mono/diheme cytochrome c family protein